jgi:hypothetical protein
MANVKVFADRQTGQNLYARGHEKLLKIGIGENGVTEHIKN